MKIKYVNRLAEIISHVQDLAERARLEQMIGLMCNEAFDAFDWNRWHDACNVPHGG